MTAQVIRLPGDPASPAKAQLRSVLNARVRSVLARLEPGEHLSTVGLVKALGFVTLEQRQYANALLYKMAQRELADCARRGPAVRVRGKGKWATKRPWLWAPYGEANPEAERCPHCRELLY